MEIVVFEANSIDDLKHTHSRYFISEENNHTTGVLLAAGLVGLAVFLLNKKWITYECQVCGYRYEESEEKVAFHALPTGWTCPDCIVGKEEFEMMAGAEAPFPE